MSCQRCQRAALPAVLHSELVNELPLACKISEKSLINILYIILATKTYIYTCYDETIHHHHQ